MTEPSVHWSEQEVPCLVLKPLGTHSCFHRPCRLALLPEKLAERFRINDGIRDNLLTNWGRFQRAMPRGSNERKILAGVVRKMRSHGMNLGDAVPALMWSVAKLKA